MARDRSALHRPYGQWLSPRRRRRCEDPRNPKDNEYPTEDGVYLTMLDADEHAVLSNPFREGHFFMYNKTHVKWWMPMPNFEN